MDTPGTIAKPGGRTGRWDQALTHWVWGLVAGWSLIVGILLVAELYGDYRRDLDTARTQADAAWARDMAYRHWVQKNGGVYVPVSQWSPPNDNLAQVAERDVLTPSGKTLTLVNSSYMFRQVANMAGGPAAVSRTTSLKPLRSENAASPKETEALKRFEDPNPPTEIAWYEDQPDGRVLQVMRPFFVEESCLKCHVQQGYKLGDVRGGITTTVSVPTVWDEAKDGWICLAAYGVLWALGMIGILVGSRKLRQAGRRQQEAADAQELANTILRTQSEISPEGVLVIDKSGMIVSVNRRFKELMEVPEELLTSGRRPLLLAHVAAKVKDSGQFLEKVRYLDEHPQEKYRDELVMSDGRILDRYSAPMTLPDGRYVGRIWFFSDITERRHTEEQLRENEEKYRAIFSAESDGIFVVDTETGAIIDCNNAITQLYGYQKEELIGQSNVMISAEPLATRLATTAAPPRIPLRYHRKKDGSVFPVEIATAALTLHGRQVCLATVRDITQRKAMEDELRSAALTDRLTGLPNRTLLLDRLQMAIERHKRTRELMYGVLFLDLDRFKTINDSLGHKMGDQLLSAVAKRLAVELRSEDTISRQGLEDTAARLGGDEFVILLENLRSEEEAVQVAQRLLKVLSEPYILGEHEIVSTASIGIVTCACGHDRAEDVLRDADTAMYEAKLRGSGQTLVFDAAMRGRVKRKMELEHGIRKALESQQFVLHYQPIVSLETGRLESLEVLLRWEHQDHGTISPVEFIPVAEETGLIVPLGEWTFQEACRQLAQWWAKGGRNSVPSISVNLSRKQLASSGLPDRLHALAREAGVEPAAIHIEVTESAIMADPKHGAAALQRMRALGFKIDMDDFGTGYSSLSCLHEFPIDVLKIDRSFILNMTRGNDFAALVNAIAMVAWNLGIRVVAEGVETAEQVPMLQSLGCHFAQGYYFARPMPAADVMPYVAKLERVGAAMGANG